VDRWDWETLLEIIGIGLVIFGAVMIPYLWFLRRRRGPFALILVLIVPSFLLAGCGEHRNVHGFDTNDFKPHLAAAWTTTPAGHQRDAGPFASVAGGFVTEAEIDQAVDDGFSAFYAKFPQFGRPEARIHITEDYVFWYGGRWAGGADEGADIMLPLFSRGTSAGDPGAEFLKRAPDGNYSWWRFTATPLLPALQHELLHRVIGDPFHLSALWAQVDGSGE
jgi:hypothetical protein